MPHATDKQQGPQRTAIHTVLETSVEATAPLWLVTADFAQDGAAGSLALDRECLQSPLVSTGLTRTEHVSAARVLVNPVMSASSHRASMGPAGQSLYVGSLVQMSQSPQREASLSPLLYR